jgi:hypothetical protein
MPNNEYMLTTLDNPFNPFDSFEEWYSYDVSKGYNTCAYLARVTKSSDELSDDDQAIAIDQAMNEIVSLNLSGLYLKIQRDYIPRVQSNRE